MANQNVEQVAGVVLLSPNYGLKDPKSNLLTLPWAKYFLPVLEGKTYSFTPDGDLQKEYWTYEYPIQALFPMMALVKLTDQLDIEKIKQPLLMMYSEEDSVVDVLKIKAVFDRFSSTDKRLIEVKNPQGRQKHVLAGDALSPGTSGFVSGAIFKFVAGLE